MVVDDDFDTALVVKLMLQAQGFEVDMFIDPRVALANFQPGKYSLAILDFRMNGLDGVELFEQLSAEDNNMNVCFTSGYEYSDVLAKFEGNHSEIPPECFFKKPLNIDEFVSRIKLVMKKQLPLKWI